MLPSQVNCRSFWCFLVMMSMPQKVKKMWVSMPSPSAALAITNDGYTMSRVPFEAMKQILRSVSSSPKSGTIDGAS